MSARKIIGLVVFAIIMAITSLIGAAITLAIAIIIAAISLIKSIEDHHSLREAPSLQDGEGRC